MTHKRGAVLHKMGLLEYRAFELTQANLATLASQHLPNSVPLVNKERFDAPDLLLPSIQKPNQSSILPKVIQGEDTGDAMEDEEYGEEYDDTRTFTVKDFKEQALRYAKDHYSTNTTNTSGQKDQSDLSIRH